MRACGESLSLPGEIPRRCIASAVLDWCRGGSEGVCCSGIQAAAPNGLPSPGTVLTVAVVCVLSASGHHKVVITAPDRLSRSGHHCLTAGSGAASVSGVFAGKEPRPTPITFRGFRASASVPEGPSSGPRPPGPSRRRASMMRAGAVGATWPDEGLTSIARRACGASQVPEERKGRGPKRHPFRTQPTH